MKKKIKTVGEAIIIIKELQSIIKKNRKEIEHLKKVASTGRSNPDDFINMFEDITNGK